MTYLPRRVVTLLPECISGYENRAVSAIVDFKLEHESDLSRFFVSLQLGRDQESLPYKLWSLKLVYRYDFVDFDWLRSCENIGPRRKHVKIILLHFLLWFPMRTLGQLWTCKNRFAFRFDFGVRCCCIFFHFVFSFWFFTQILHVILRQ